jgi:hypothetical protein
LSRPTLECEGRLVFFMELTRLAGMEYRIRNTETFFEEIPYSVFRIKTPASRKPPTPHSALFYGIIRIKRETGLDIKAKNCYSFKSVFRRLDIQKTSATALRRVGTRSLRRKLPSITPLTCAERRNRPRIPSRAFRAKGKRALPKGVRCFRSREMRGDKPVRANALRFRIGHAAGPTAGPDSSGPSVRRRRRRRGPP